MDVPFYSFFGTHYEIGLQQGIACRESIKSAWKQLTNHKEIEYVKPRVLPKFIFLALAKHGYTQLLRNDIFRYYPKQAQRLVGIAKGAGIDLPSLLLLVSLEMFVDKPSYKVEACTGLGLKPAITANDEAIVAKNFDLPYDIGQFNLTCETKPEGRYKVLGTTMTPLAGMNEGLNEHGLAVSYNYVYTTDTTSCFVPLSMVLQEMLETCKTTKEAVKFITHAKRGGHAALLMVGDAEGDVRTVEITSRHSDMRRQEENLIVNTNHYQTRKMSRLEVPRKAVYFGPGIPKTLSGQPIHESSRERMARVKKLLKGKVGITESDIIRVLRDHGDNNECSAFTICRHGEIAGTLRSIMLFPNRRTIKVLYGKPCENEYSEFGFTQPKTISIG